MKVLEKLQKKKPTISFEFFPPKTEDQEAHLFQVVSELKKFGPDFASITYGAMGGTREKTFLWAKKIKDEFDIEPVAHLTCISATKKSIKKQISELENYGVTNILALRGDPPSDVPDFIPPADGFSYAKDLISYIKGINHHLCLGAAGFPESKAPIEYLKQKIDAGAEYIITQMFFDNNYYFDFVQRCGKAGINVPIIPGIMPITNLKQIKKITQTCGATIPKDLLSDLEKNNDNHGAVLKIGVEHAACQCRQLLAADIPGLHCFVMNQSGPISAIFRQLGFQGS